MCCLFGMMDYGHGLSRKQRNRLLAVLAAACEERGTDATGIAYHSRGALHVEKRPVPAHKMRVQLPGDVWTVMGHTRMTTQGSEKHNCNNHPFLGRTREGEFALAHNGVIRNDKALRRKLSLPKTRIETDSYVAVQLLEREGVLNFDSLRAMAEQVEGSFTFTLLGPDGVLYLVKGDNPMCLYHYPKTKLYLYASTERILQRALQQLRLPLGKPVRIEVQCGELLSIHPDGTIRNGTFDSSRLFPLWQRPGWYPCWGGWWNTVRRPKQQEERYLEELKAVASVFGYTPEDIDRLALEGYTPEEVEEFLYCGDHDEVLGR